LLFSHSERLTRYLTPDSEQKDFFQVGFYPIEQVLWFLLNEFGCVRRRRQLKELEKLGPKMKGIGDYWLISTDYAFGTLVFTLFL
jgi:hypothetical protein